MSDEYYRTVFMENLNFYLSFRQKKQSDLCKDLNLSKSTVSSWCTGKKIPRMDKIELLANYLKIDKSDLIEERKPSKPSVPDVSEIVQYVYGQPKKQTKDEKEIEKIIENTIENLSNTDGLMFDGEVPATEEEIEQLKSAMRIGLAMAKEKARQKFTPKKYRKDNQTENK